MRINPIPLIFAATLGGAAYLIGGPTAAAWTLVGWGVFVCVVSILPR